MALEKKKILSQIEIVADEDGQIVAGYAQYRKIVIDDGEVISSTNHREPFVSDDITARPKGKLKALLDDGLAAALDGVEKQRKRAEASEASRDAAHSLVANLEEQIEALEAQLQMANDRIADLQSKASVPLNEE